ncbi:MAG: hypothetical protein AB7U64_22585 [Blastocatellales bacterium]
MAKEVALVPKLIKWPEDWVAAIDEARGEIPFSDFVRDAVRARLTGALSEMPAWGQGRPSHNSRKRTRKK